MKASLWPLLALLCGVAAASVVQGETIEENERFYEEVLLKPFRNGDVLAEFNFVTLTSGSGGSQHFDLMPKVVGEFIVDHQLEELQVALTRGVWRWEHPARPAPTGAMVAARFVDDVTGAATDDVIDGKWRRLTNALSGQFCASLNFLDSARTSVPQWSFNPIGASPAAGPGTGNRTTSGSHFRYGTLPGENVCTENLTPWKKLLPCGGKRGLASLLNARSIHRTSYHSIGLSMRKVCAQGSSSCTDPSTELRLHVSLVFDPSSFPENSNKHRKMVKLNSNNWSLRSLFGIGINSRCPMAEKSTVFVAQSLDMNDLLTLEPKGDDLQQNPANDAGLTYNKERVHTYDVEKLLATGKHNIHAVYSEKFVLEPARNPVPVLSVNRYQTGYGQEKGGIVTQLRNGGSSPLTVVLYDVIPWFLRVYFHSLRIKSVLSLDRVRHLQPLKSKFTPGVDRAKPYTLELVVTLPPNSVTQVAIDFEHSILKWNEYPPDANKGFYVGSALVSTVLPGSASKTGMAMNAKHSTFGQHFESCNNKADTGEDLVLVQLYTESLLVSLPTPDFSMPYNVICLACTVVALAFGPLLNLTTKSLMVEEVGPKSGAGGTLSGLLAKLPVINKFVGKKPVENSDNEDQGPSNEKESDQVSNSESTNQDESKKER